MAQQDDREFEIDAQGDAGASTTYPLEAGQIRRGGHICIKNRACKVADVSTSKTGKHGHAKCHFVGIDIFNGKKMEELCPSSHNAVVPNVSRKDYQIMDCESDAPGDPISLIDMETDEVTDMFNMPPDQEVCKELFAAFETGEDCIVTVTEAMGHAQIMSVRKTELQ